MRIIIVVLMACLLSGCGSIISRTIRGAGPRESVLPGVKWDLETPHGATSPCWICHSR